ncbi:MAG: GNAT family N-acetyltransferase [Psychrilyobacter sp.]|uniref:GNAT family N-acetyltransferase n=1 Tax=Psychrilyobacter sp. TaxID=2586924 RepID=UPI003C71F1D0
MKFLEIHAKDKKYIEQIIEVEKEAFGVSGGVDEWILKPIIRYGKVFILVIEEEVIGIAEYIRDFHGDEVFLYGFSIKKKYRKCGYGKKLLEESIKVFRENKIKKIGLTVSLENQEAIELYKKIGFKMEDMLKDEYGKGVDRLYFGKEI